MSDEWYYSTDGMQHGPVSLQALRELVRAGRVQTSDLVWRDGMAQWQPAQTTPQVFEQALASISSPPAQAYAAFPPFPPNGPPSQLNYYTPATTAIAYAGFWLRFGAALLDGILLLIVGWVLGFIFQVIGAGMERGGVSPPAAGLFIAGSNLTQMVIGWLYAALMESSTYQATLGKLAVGIRVTDARGQRITFARATGRHFAKYVSMLTFFIGYLMAAFTAHKQALHDMIASCLVIRGR